MTKSAIHLSLSATFVIVISGLRPAPLAAAKAVTFTVTVKSAFLRSGPGLNWPRVYSVFQGQVFSVNGRNGDVSWLRLDFAGASSETWVVAAYGETNGDVNSAPVVEAALNPPTQVAAATSPDPVSAAPNLRFTVIAKSVFARSAPGGTGRGSRHCSRARRSPPSGAAPTRSGFNLLSVAAHRDGSPRARAS